MSSKETDGKLRWETTIDGISFKLYIPKWRVPEPWPGRIAIRIDPRRTDATDSPNLSPHDAVSDPAYRLEPIVATVEFASEHSQTLRYDPVGDPKLWEIGSPYVPMSLTHDAAKRLRVLVFWEMSTRGEFADRMTKSIWDPSQNPGM